MNVAQWSIIMEHPHLNRTEFAVLVALAFEADEVTGQCAPGRETIAEKARVTVRCAEQTVAKLVARRFLTEVSPGGGQSKKARYEMHAERGLPEGKPSDTAKGVRPLEDSYSEGDSLYGSLYSEAGSPFGSKGEAYTANGVRSIDPNSEGDSLYNSQTANGVRRIESAPIGRGRTRGGGGDYSLRESNQRIVSGGGDTTARESAPPPPPTSTNFNPQPQTEAERALLGLCRATSTSQKDLAAWPSARAVILAPDATEHGPAQTDDVREFEKRFAERFNDSPYLSQVPTMWRRLMNQPPRSKTEAKPRTGVDEGVNDFALGIESVRRKYGRNGTGTGN